MFETEKQAGMEKFVKAGVAGTFDLGVEYGIGDVREGEPMSHFAPHMQPSQLRADDGENDADFGSHEPSSGFLFDKMLSVAALLHILDNIDKDLHHSLKGFDRCMQNLTAITSLLCYEGPRQAFVARVVNGGGFHHRASCFHKTFALHSEHRWLSVLLTIMWLLPLREVLQEVWDARLFGRYDSKQGDLNVDAITAAIFDEWFWSYLFMVHSVSCVLAKLSQWAEDCPCHSQYWRDRPSFKSRYRMGKLEILFKKLVGQTNGRFMPWNTCPGRGKRAFELACGVLEKVCNELFESEMMSLLNQCRGLSEEDHQFIMSDWSIAKTQVVATLLLKTQHWSVLPWKFFPLRSKFSIEVRKAMPRTVLSTPA